MRDRPQVVVVDHYDSYTWNLVHLVAGVTGELPTVVQHDAVEVAELAAYSHLVLAPGPGHPALPTDFGLGAAVFALGRPVLGVCLGMQALVTAFGGLVEVGEPAHGDLARIRHDGRGVFAGLPREYDVVRYHSLVATRVPACLEVTATCGNRTVMGVRHRDLPLEGVQFHPESVLSEHGTELVTNFLHPPAGT